jgi:hypothetical protein
MAANLHIKIDRQYYMRQYHGISPMVKSKCIEAINSFNPDYFFSTITNFRQDKNMNQYIFTNYCTLTEYRAESEVQFEYCGAEKPKHLIDALTNTKAQILCANDCATGLSDLQLTQLQIICARILEHRFPEKSKYEN